MGLLIEGTWYDQWYDTKSNDGHFVRPDPAFRDWVEPHPNARFPAEAGRYHLYVSLACPWAHRALIMRKLKGLEDVISVSVVHPYMGQYGWQFGPEYPGATPDHIHGYDYLHQLYQHTKPDYTGRVTVPALWDTHTDRLVNNESADLIRMLGYAFDAWASDTTDYYPEAHREAIDAINDRVYHAVNNGVYRAGFATTQHAYEEAVTKLFDALDELDERLARQRYLTGDRITEADWRLFTTLVRFDAVYVGHFKCNRRRISDYPHLSGYLRELYQVPGVAETVDFDHIKRHYYTSHPHINPTRIIPVGPDLDLEAPHGRGP